MSLEAMVFGVVIGVAVVVAATRLGDRLHSQIRPALMCLLFGPQAPSVSQIPSDALRDLERDAPHLYEAVQQPSAARVEDQPAEVTPEAVARIRDAEDVAAAQKVARSLILNPDVADVVAVLVKWNPRRHYTEDKYQRSFKSYASKNGYAGRLQEKPQVTWGAEGSDPNRVGYPDFALGDPDRARHQVLLELKANLTSSAETDRAMGQMLRYLLAWKKHGPAVLAVCGDAPPEFCFLIRLYINSWREKLHLPITVWFKRDDVIAADKLALMPDDDEE